MRPILLLTLCALAVSGCSRSAGMSTQTVPDDLRAANAQESRDLLQTSVGMVRLVPVHHGTLRLELGETIIWIDPWSQGDLSGPKADIVLITHIHPDHYDPAALAAVKKEGTIVVAPAVVAEKEEGAIVLANGETHDFGAFSVEAVPMYNLVRGPEPGKLFHEKGRGNGYLLTFGYRRVYVSGDTECTDEMKALEHIDVAFVSMNLPYTMPPSEAAVCIRAFRPAVIYPYHYRGSDLGELSTALADEEGIELRILDWY